MAIGTRDAQRAQLGAVDRDARRADEHVAAGQGGSTASGRVTTVAPSAISSGGVVAGSRARRPRSAAAGASGRAGGRTTGSRRPAPQTPIAGRQAPRNAWTSSISSSGTACVVAQREALRRAPAPRRNARQDLRDEPADDRLVAPARVGRQHPDRRQALLLLADALERLVAAGRGEEREALELPLVVEHRVAEDVVQVAGS